MSHLLTPYACIFLSDDCSLASASRIRDNVEGHTGSVMRPLEHIEWTLSTLHVVFKTWISDPDDLSIAPMVAEIM